MQSWDEAGRLYHALFDEPAEKPDTDIAAQVETLVSGKPMTLSKIDALYNYVSREIRYVAIEIGIGGYQPHPAPDVYKNKYGDCKDKATLLMTMLDHIGLRGYPALVGTRGASGSGSEGAHACHLRPFDRGAAGSGQPAACGGAVSRRTMRKTKFSGLTRPRNSTRSGRFRKWIKAFSRSSRIRTTAISAAFPKPSPHQNGIQYKAHVRLQADGTGTADVEVKYLGHE